MAKTMQVLNVCSGGNNFVCVFDNGAKRNPYKVYQKWYDVGWHRKKVAEYGDFTSVLCHLVEIYRA